MLSDWFYILKFPRFRIKSKMRGLCDIYAWTYLTVFKNIVYNHSRATIIWIEMKSLTRNSVSASHAVSFCDIPRLLWNFAFKRQLRSRMKFEIVLTYAMKLTFHESANVPFIILGIKCTTFACCYPKRTHIVWCLPIFLFTSILHFFVPYLKYQWFI